MILRIIISLVVSVVLAWALQLVLPTVGAVETFGFAQPAFWVVAVFMLASIWISLALSHLLNLERVVDNREEGVVKWFNGAKGFGFVTRENGDDVFVHFRSIRGRGHRTLHEGQRVKFGVVDSAKGLQAEDVSVIRTK